MKKGSNFTCPVGQVGWEVQLSDRYFLLSRAVGQSLMSIPECIVVHSTAYTLQLYHCTSNTLIVRHMTLYETRQEIDINIYPRLYFNHASVIRVSETCERKGALCICYVVIQVMKMR